MAEQWLWRQVQDMGPAARMEPEMAWCGVRGRATLWGGHLPSLVKGQFSYCIDTWEWDGTLWTQVDDTGPAGRNNPALCTDASGGVLLFGGMFAQPGGGPEGARWYNDTWRWDGSGWVQLADMGPAPRQWAQMTLDQGAAHVVLYGGMAGPGQATHFTDTWIWDGASWTQVADSGPAPQMDAFMVWDAVGKRVIWCAADQGMWEWDSTATQWRRVQDIVPPSGVGASTIPTGVLAFGGVIDPPQPPEYYSADTWTWDGMLWRRVQDFGPPPRVSSALCWDADRNRVVLFGGTGTEATGPVFALGDTWETAIPSG